MAALVVDVDVCDAATELTAASSATSATLSVIVEYVEVDVGVDVAIALVVDGADVVVTDSKDAVIDTPMRRKGSIHWWNCILLPSQ